MEGRDAIAGRSSSNAPEVTGSHGRWDVRRVEVTESTNADVMALGRAGEPEGVVVVADHQTAGRGRAGRTWSAPAGSSLLMTVLLRPPAKLAPLVTAALALAAADAVDDVAGFSPELKWPNDLVVESENGSTRKLAGVLAEAEWPSEGHSSAGHRPPGEHERALVAAGVGLNVRWPLDLPDDLADIAVAMNHVAPGDHRVEDVLSALLERLSHRYGDLTSGRHNAVLDDWRARSATLGRDVRVDLGIDEVVGRAVEITDDGHLVVETNTGHRRTLAVGDVVHLRRG